MVIARSRGSKREELGVLSCAYPQEVDGRPQEGFLEGHVPLQFQKLRLCMCRFG